MSFTQNTHGYSPRDPDQRPFASGEFVANVKALKVVQFAEGKRYCLVNEIINVVKPKPDNEAVMSDEITIWGNPDDEKSSKKFRDQLFVSGLDAFLDFSSDEALEASFPSVTNKLVYIKAWKYKNKEGGESQSAQLKSKNLLTPENSQVTL